MAEKRESTITARVFVRGPSPTVPLKEQGWYFEFEGEDPQGPFFSELSAGRAARNAILLATASDTDSDPLTGLPLHPHNRRGIERRMFSDTHFAGSDRRMSRGDRRTERATASRERSPDFSELGVRGPAEMTDEFVDRLIDRAHALQQHGMTNDQVLAVLEKVEHSITRPPIDHRLDRVDGRGRYGVVDLRKVRALVNEDAVLVSGALAVLIERGLLNIGPPKSEGEFFVLMLKDEFAAPALLTYANNARHAGMVEYADDVLDLAFRAGCGSPWCKRPD